MLNPISSLSKEAVRVPVSADQGGVPYNPTGDTVQLALVPDTFTAPSTWYSGTWEAAPGPSGTTYYAVLVVGPGSTVGSLAAGSYTVYVKVTDTVEVPVLRAQGTLTVY